MTPAGTLPWGRPRREWLLLALVAAAALTPIYRVNAQDVSRLCLAQALAHGSLHNDGCFGLDVSRYRGHEYTDKGPGLSFVELPIAEAVGLPPANVLRGAPWRLWIVRILSVGVPFLVCTFLIGRIGEGLAPGFGGMALVAFALGTLAGPFAAISFAHVPAAALGFGAFLLAWRRQPLWAGVLAGAAVVFDYETGLIGAVVAAYLAVDAGRVRRLGAFALGLLPGAVVLGTYDQLAFGAPWHLSYRYVANVFQAEQSHGFFGIGLPHLYGAYEVFSGSGGLLVASPVLLAALGGLVLFGRRFRREAIVAAAVTGLLVLVNSGYFLPYGGSPGPRFLIPALPFLALGLAPALAWRPRLTVVLTLVSVLVTTVLMIVWTEPGPLRGGVWGELARVPSQLGSSRLVTNLEATVFGWALPGRTPEAVAVAVAALAALGVAISTIPRESLRPRRQERPAASARVLVLACVCLVAAAQASVVVGYPYPSERSDLAVRIQASTTRPPPGQEVDFNVETSNTSGYQGYGRVFVTIVLPPGARLAGPPAYERGSGCKGTTTLTCFLDNLSPGIATSLRFGVSFTQLGPQSITAVVAANGLPKQKPAAVRLDVG